MSNIKIQGVEVVHPEKSVDNQYYLDHFLKQGKKIDRLLEAYGRNKRYICDNEKENILTMATKAGEKVLKSCNLTGKDIDLFIFSTQTPEYIWPTNSIIVFGNLDINPNAQVFDLNANCLGMLTAILNANSVMKGNPRVNRALIIGSDEFSTVSNPNNEYLYPILGDSACAVVLERTEDENEGILDIEFYSQGKTATECSRYPNNGFKELFLHKDREMFTWWDPVDASFLSDTAIKDINAINQRMGIDVTDIDHFCYSQFNKSLIKRIAKGIDVDFDKFVYIGDEYGYTGTTSPFIALYEGIKSGRIKRGDMVSIWSVGLWWVTAALIMRF